MWRDRLLLPVVKRFGYRKNRSLALMPRSNNAMKSFATILKSIALTLLLATTAFAADKVNINTADASALEATLVGIGPSKAQAIVDYRKANGPFKSAEELAMVKGIGLKMVEKNRDRIELRAAAGKPAGGAATAAPKSKPVTRR
jgi:competence protein ComEA